MKQGFVALVGAGPGSVDLLTIRARKYIQQADVIVFDRLVSTDILKLIPKDTKLINVGKQSSNHIVPQDGINKILLEQAQLGKLVVRLKGGDPFVFGRGGEELELLCKHNINFEVVPGITSAISVPTYAGIPVSHRDFCSSIHFITGHQKENEPLNINFEALVATKGTLVFLMGVSSLPQIMQGLITAGIDPNTPAAVIENGTRNNQRKVLATVCTLFNMAQAHRIKSPSIIIVGKVCQLSDEYDWFSKRELCGCEVIVTRPEHIASSLTASLSDLGALVHDYPCIQIQRIAENTALQTAISNLSQYSWLVFTSKNGVQIFFEQLRELQLDVRALAKIKLAAVGSQTAKELTQYGLIADYVPQVFDGEHLAHGLVERTNTADNILLVRARIGSERILEILAEQGRQYLDVPVYDTLYTHPDTDNILQAIERNPNIYLTFTSASTVDGFIKALGQAPATKLNAICIGKQTAQAAARYNFKIHTASQATIPSMLEKVKEIYHANQTTQA